MNVSNVYEILTSSGTVETKSLHEIFAQAQKTILYFYPKDNTPWCTIENKDFSCLKEQFENIGIQLVWVSKDSIESHKKFVEKQDLQVALIADPDLVLHKELGAYGEKNNYGKIVQGVIRSTFLVNSKGEIMNEWRNIRAKGHAERMLKEMQS